ncbi:30S ribosome-binding factor RbfA [Thiopseudomonas acetoxidans]|uniref:Ribosome-binding factor A n=1 Tax=Thiopseudomonas acetoxidans TaxID=3041622 RepID=A0ABT7SPT9_9GAMM|nr:30S ribosome-binding factor RbfA [Thiopseudomonas sp. CY1220]MDM7858213.1 30S ribosome-binding factor RbfA [Thiopseudomonas sp. CY1220]NLC10375.1 30S ribosome-binding factor RbfA [Gammaproteobacteria bacterium]
MAKQYSRAQRVGDQIQRELAMLIPREVKDPRLGFITVTGVDVSRDMGHAKVFITLMNNDSAEDIEQNLEVLSEVAGYLRMLLGKSMKMRSVPQLHFRYDESISRGAYMSALIEKAVASDRSHEPAGGDE